jgi:ribosomal protein S27E
VDDAWDYAQRGGWWIHRGYYVAVCEDCYDPEKIYHAQRKNVFCVLCQTGEHIAVIK